MISRYFFPFLSASALLSVPAIAMAQQTTPLSLQPCIRQLNTKSTPIKAAFINATYREGGRTYYFLHLFPPRMEIGVRDAVISSSPSSCKTHAQYPSGNPIPVTTSIPLSVARGLTLNILKSHISESGGPQKYEAFLNSAAQDTGKLYLDSNKVWALKQLGIQILPSIKILPNNQGSN